MRLFFKRRFFVLVVCTANRTRSPYLAGCIRHMIRQIRPGALRSIRVESAGTHAVSGGRINDTVALLARRNGFSLRPHRATRLSRHMVRRADLILVMEQAHKEWVLAQWPQADHKTFLVMEFGWQQEEDDEGLPDVPDPTGSDAEMFRTFEAIAHAEASRVVHELVRRGVVR